MSGKRKRLNETSSRHLRRLVQNNLCEITELQKHNLRNVSNIPLKTEICHVNEHESHNHSDILHNETRSNIDNLNDSINDIDNLNDSINNIDNSNDSINDIDNANDSINDIDYSNDSINDIDNSNDFINSNETIIYTYKENEILVLDDQDNIKNIEEKSFKSLLHNWAVTNNITHTALRELLKIFRTLECFSNLPLDPRTLLHTPSQTEIKIVSPGTFVYFGVRIALEEYFVKYNSRLENICTINIGINIDGLPISRSSTSSLWPILGCVLPYKEVFIIGAYYGSKKPNNCKDFLKDLVEEMIELINNGIFLCEKLYNIKIKQIVCDAPAKSFILNVKGHSGYFSCTKCTVEGEYRNGRVCFADICSAKTTNNSFLSETYENYHLGSTILIGRKHVLLFGDLLQYMKILLDSLSATNLWTLFHYDEPTINMRQQGDGSYRKLLSRIPVGLLTPSDYDILERKKISFKGESFETRLSELCDFINN
ncbi:hypothetical protein ALC57_03199 [Trachymyrmex cornetzi]|uniref:DUF4806 domain-containing protein n=1 Tax=Trachymyrmex cornetzi TaxID=471704 RepID=A0A151JMJ1_9HYME|nr:hypothetical protein ALC57_03199 [Trachymyrmex cornetzi]